MGKFTGKVVLITGAGKGIGRDLALVFAEQGAIVIANALTPVNLDETVKRIQAEGGQAQGIVADIASKLALQTMINDVLDQHGHLDILIQTAGIEPRDTLLGMDEWDWRRTLDSNLTGPFLLMQSVGRVMRQQGEGVIVNLVGVNKNSSAAAGKVGLLTLTHAAAAEFENYGIRVNAVSCGTLEGEHSSEFPDDPLELVIFLCSGASSNVNGKIIRSSGWLDDPIELSTP